ncbi:MAG: YfhO family protein [Bacillota bacterium]|nr:YfhO family protein [Bacillota bacterium]
MTTKIDKLVVAAFLAPALIVLLALAVTGIYPFGDQQIAVIDMYHQYVPFLGELQYKLQSGGNLFYTWNAGGGSNFWCLLSYYGASPLNLLLILFPGKLLMEGITVILLIKIGLTGSFMYYYLIKVHNPSDSTDCREKGIHTVAFSTMYALCSYVIGYYWCIMWLDAVMLLPLVVLGLNDLIDRGKLGLYTITLAIVIFSNYYIAIMVCIFIMIYYPILYFIKREGCDTVGIKDCIKTTAKALGGSLLAIGMSSIMLLPTYISMKDTYYFKSDMPEDWTLYEDILDLINQLLPNAHLTYLEGLPNVSAGLLAVITLVFYYITKEISIREKFLNTVILVVLFFSMNVNKLDFIWHGMHFPNQLPFRFSFVVTFLIVAMGYRAFNRIDRLSMRSIMVVIGSGGIYYVLAQKLLPAKIDNMELFLYLGLILLALYGAVLYMYKKGTLIKRDFKLAIVIVLAAELCITTCSSFDTIGNSSRSTYNENRTDIMKLMSYVNDMAGPIESGGDGSFSRVELDSFIIHNCPALYHYRGMGQFSSTINTNNTRLMSQIGLEGDPGSNRFDYVETDPVTNLLTNINYLVSKSDKIQDPDFELIKVEGNSRLYKNAYQSSLGYVVADNIRTWDFENPNPIENLDAFIRDATKGQVDGVFIDQGQGEIETDNIESHYENKGTVVNELVNATSDAEVDIRYKADKTQKYYIYLECDGADSIDVEREDEKDGVVIEDNCGAIVNLGEIKEGETFSARIKMKQGRADTIICHVSAIDYDKWNKAYDILTRSQMKVISASDTSIKGEIDAKSAGLLIMSIPYENGWTLKVDGHKKEITELTGNSWISTGLSEGKHTVELRFLPPKFYLGLAITVLSILILIGLSLLGRRFTRIAISEQAVELPQECPEEESDCSIESE